MAMHQYSTATARINEFKGKILAHAVPRECLVRAGRHIEFPKNNSKTYTARRFLPYGATSGSITASSDPQNTFFGTTTLVDRNAAIVNAHLTQEGVTPTPDSITPVDVTVDISTYSCLYGYSNDVAELYEDDIPGEEVKLCGERLALVNECITFGALKAGTNKYYGGTGTTRATVNGPISMNMLRRISMGLQASHGAMVTRVLKASGLYNTEAVAAGYLVYCSTDLESDIRDMENFIPAEKYSSGTPMENEIGKVERFRFITSPEFPAIRDAATSTTASTYDLHSSAGTNPDVYQFIVLAADAFSHIAVRGAGQGMDPTHIPHGKKDKSDPLGQRGYVGVLWRKAVLLENDGWMAVGEVGRTNIAN